MLQEGVQQGRVHTELIYEQGLDTGHLYLLVAIFTYQKI